MLVLLGDIIKLRGHPESSIYQVSVERRLMAGLMTWGTVKTIEIGQSAAKSPRGCCSQTKWWWAIRRLRYSRTFVERRTWLKKKNIDIWLHNQLFFGELSGLMSWMRCFVLIFFLERAQTIDCVHGCHASANWGILRLCNCSGSESTGKRRIARTTTQFY